MGLRAHASRAVFLYTDHMALLALLTLLIAAPAIAEQAAPAPAAQEFVSPETLRARAEALRDAVADHSVSDISIKTRAHGFFENVQTDNLVVPVRVRLMEREPVLGKMGTIAGMQAEADRRIERWKRTHSEPPPPDLEAAVAQARDLKDGARLSYDTEGNLQDNQMGIFKYVRGTTDAGLVKLNERMKLLTALVGEAFTYATVAHESQHARDHAAGRLTPEQEIAGEISAFRVQYLWLKLMDPSGERMLTLHGTLRMERDRAVDPKIKVALAQAVTYLEHLSAVVETNGEEGALKKLVEGLGYSDSHDHGGDHAHETRGSSSPTSA